MKKRDFAWGTLQYKRYEIKCPYCRKLRSLSRGEYLAIIRGVRSKMCFVCANKCRRGNRTSFKKGNIPWNKGTKGVMVAWNKGTSKKTFCQRIKHTSRWIETRKKIFERDDYSCQECGSRGNELHPHHILPKSTHPELVFELSNIITLCKECHKKTDTYGNRLNKERSHNVKQLQVS